jgi:cytochrome c biogenesis protein CcdA
MLLTGRAYSYEQVILEFFYWDPNNYCSTCPSLHKLYQDFLAKNQTMNRIREDYRDKVVFKWIDTTSREGMEKKQLYNIHSNSLYAIVINGKIICQGDDFNETYVREALEMTLRNSSTPISLNSTKPLDLIFVSAFLFGFLETFSPCLIALLAFILSYTIGKTTVFKDAFLHVIAFALGFLLAVVSIGLTLGLMFLSLQTFNTILVWIICILAIFIGLNLLGVFRTSFKEKTLIAHIVKKYAYTYGGIFMLGFLFYFLDPCIAPIFFAVLPLLTYADFLPILLAFCLGVMLPFIGIGIFTASISQLTRITYRHRRKIRSVSGLVLIIYSVYIIYCSVLF